MMVVEALMLVVGRARGIGSLMLATITGQQGTFLNNPKIPLIYVAGHGEIVEVLVNPEHMNIGVMAQGI